MSAKFESHEIHRALGQPPGTGSRHYTGVSIDSREVRPGHLFVALRGTRVDGSDYLDQAARRGATGAIVPADMDMPDIDMEWFSVPDTLRALGDLARFARRRGGVRVIGVTGSSGKTTVKEMLALALSEAVPTWATPGNLNSLSGLPLAILRANPEARYWVLELGSSAPGEVARLTAIAEPDDAVVTTVGAAHLEGFGNINGVLREKLSLIRMAHSTGRAVVGELPAELATAARQIREDVVVAGLQLDADFRPDRYELGAESVSFERSGVEYRLHVGGEHHLRDALLAAAMAEQLGVEPVAVARGLARFRPLGMRGALIRAGSLTIIADCYNANPESFEAAIKYCETSFPGRPRSAVVASMLELGAESAEAHRTVARRLLDAGFDRIYALGEFRGAFEQTHNGSGRVATTASVAEAVAGIAAGVTEGEVVLVKASRGERLERVVEGLLERCGEGRS
ncbi:MAG: UDP-N-acetylmuramoyl-tripeptide--D-alanyl-D-alanine ligase [Gemmatimonadales bacterium]|nr:MAG: UDP-N-acetylmuramoyl-tripeptide--D-alanyl-D-alanine ligase [Gemmatimonadales bacterium]